MFESEMCRVTWEGACELPGVAHKLLHGQSLVLLVYLQMLYLEQLCCVWYNVKAM